MRFRTLSESMAAAEPCAGNPPSTLCVPTGIQMFDLCHGGLPRGGLTVMAGVPEHGMNAFALQTAVHAASSCNLRVLVASVRTADAALARRAADILKATRALEDKHETELFNDLPLYFAPSPLMDPGAWAQRIADDFETDPFDLIIVMDLEGVCFDPDEALLEELCAETRVLNMLARQTHAAVLTTVGIAVDEEQRLKLSDLRGAGVPEWFADMVMGIQWKAATQDRKLHVMKLRNGTTGSYEVGLDPTGTFVKYMKSEFELAHSLTEPRTF